MSAWLGRDVDCPIPTNLVSTQKVSIGQGQDDLGPATDIIRTEINLKGVVPNNSSIGLLRFICMLGNSCSVSFNNIPVGPSNKVVLSTQSIILIYLSRLDVSTHKNIESLVLALVLLPYIQVVAAISHAIPFFSGEKAIVHSFLDHVEPLSLLLVELLKIAKSVGIIVPEGMGIRRPTSREKLVIRTEIVNSSTSARTNNRVRRSEVEILLIIMELHF